MRDIKFRAWDVKNKGWVAGFNMVNYHSYFNKGLTPSIFRYSSEWEDGEYELEQYSGLKDKNGVRIYEGDIINMSGHYYLDDDDEWYERTMTGKLVILASKGACLRKPSWRDQEESDMHGIINYDMPISACKCTVIGNVHKNPELLEI